MSELTERIIDHSRELFGNSLRYWSEKISDFVESPIEHAFCLSLIAGMNTHGIPWFIYDDREMGKKDILENKIMNVIIIPQCPISDYRVDFLLITRRPDGNTTEIVIECDGHDFHERTKEQAEHDRTRDRQLQALELKVFRFTGSEIFRDPLIKAREIYEYVWRIANGVAT